MTQCTEDFLEKLVVTRYLERLLALAILSCGMLPVADILAVDVGLREQLLRVFCYVRMAFTLTGIQSRSSAACRPLCAPDLTSTYQDVQSQPRCLTSMFT